MSVRGIRQSIRSGVVLGNLGCDDAQPQQIDLRRLGKALAGSGPAGSTFGQIADKQVVANISGVSNTPVGVGVSALIDAVFGSAQGDVLYRDAAVWKVLAPGTIGFVLTTGGPAANPSWAAAATPSTFVDAEIPTGTINGVNAAFTLANTPVVGSVHLYLNGLRMRPTTDFTVAGTTITYSAGAKPQTGDNHYADYRK